MNLSNFKVSTRLGGSFALLLALVLTIVLAAGVLIKRVNDGGVFYFENIVPSLANIADARGDLEAIRHAEANHIMSNSYEEMDAIEQSIASKREHLTSTIAAYEKLVADDEDKRRWQKAQADAVTYLTFWEKLRLVSRQTTTDPTAFEKARNIFEIDERKAFETALNSLEKMWDHNETLGSGVIREAGTAYNTAKYTLGALGLLALTLGSLSAMLISRSITSQLGGEPMTATELARSIAGSDLSVHVPLQSGDNGSMMANFQVMVDSLSHVVREVRQNAEGVASVSTQIAQGNMDLSQRTEEYASSLEQTASSMEELRSVSRHNADNVKQANQLALGASSVAARGGAVVDEVVETMKGINEASSKIADIINVIDGIAFQTNILALNASVEAARAGEQGRGFAVVASEVRNLAQRSAEAAKEIKTLITTSVERVARGTVLVDQAGHTMADVVASIKRMTDLMNEIDIAINEQSTSVAQISDAVTQMDQMTQQNASLIEESAAAAGSLKQQAYDLVRAVAVFKLVRGNASSPALLSLPQPIAA